MTNTWDIQKRVIAAGRVEVGGADEVWKMNRLSLTSHPAFTLLSSLFSVWYQELGGYSGDSLPLTHSQWYWAGLMDQTLSWLVGHSQPNRERLIQRINFQATCWLTHASISWVWHAALDHSLHGSMACFLTDTGFWGAWWVISSHRHWTGSKKQVNITSQHIPPLERPQRRLRNCWKNMGNSGCLPR